MFALYAARPGAGSADGVAAQAHAAARRNAGVRAGDAVYKVPSLHLVLRRMIDSGWAFLRRAGTLILASMVVVWALLYFPRGGPNHPPYDVRIAEMQKELDELKEEGESTGRSRRRRQEINALMAEWKQQSYLGRMGKAIEPVVRPLGWDWKIGMAALASFPAREVVIGTLGIIYSEGKQDSDEHPRSRQRRRDALGPRA